MKDLFWKADKGLLVECLNVTADRSLAIEFKVRASISAGMNTIDLMNKMREFCETDEEWTSFVFALGFYQGTTVPFGFKIT